MKTYFSVDLIVLFFNVVADNFFSKNFIKNMIVLLLNHRFWNEESMQLELYLQSYKFWHGSQYTSDTKVAITRNSIYHWYIFDSTKNPAILHNEKGNKGKPIEK